MSKKAIVDLIPVQSTAYVGPGDLVASALAWYGLRAYSLATAGNNCVDIVRASDSTTNTFTTLANGSVDLASITTFLASTTGKITKLYDQTGGGLHVVQASDGSRPTFTFSAIGSLPGISFPSPTYLQSAGNISATSIPWSASTAINRGSSAIAVVAAVQPGGAAPIAIGTDTSGKIGIYASSWKTATCANSANHSIQAVGNNTSSTIDVDGTDAGISPGSRGIPAGAVALGRDGFGDYFGGTLYEFGFWGGGFDATQKANLTTNQTNYWGI